jgi:radical SAM-linked protein
VIEPSPAGPARLRFRFEKLGKVRFTSHRDAARMWERAFARSGLPISWSAGFSPHPQLSFGLALPTGAESLAEYLDVKLEENSLVAGPCAPRPAADPALDGLAETLSGLLPIGVAATGIAAIGETMASLQQEVTSCNWELEVLGLAASEVASRVRQLLDAPSVAVERVRKGRVVDADLRPGVRSLSIDTLDRASGPVLLTAELSTQPVGVRPAELVHGLDAGLSLARARRTHQWIERDGQRWEPLALRATGARTPVQHAEERAS